MKKNLCIIIFTASLITGIISCSRPDEVIIRKIEKECKVTFDHQTNGVGAQVYHLWSIKGNEIFIFDEKMKNTIDRTLNVLPDKKKVREFNAYSGRIESYYHWETPQTTVQLSIEYYDDKGGTIKIYIENK